MFQTTGNASHELRRSWFQVGDVLQSDSGGLYRGERFTLLNFGERYIGRGGFTHKDAGTYIDFATLHIIGKFGKKMFARADSFERQPLQSTHGQMDAVQIKISDLPETPFWEGDTVSFRREKYVGLFASEMANKRHTVTEIKYNAGTCGDFQVRMTSGEGSAGASISGTRLVERGNIWKYQHGESLSFSDIEEEAKFHRSLGMSQKISILTHEVRGNETSFGRIGELKKEFEFAEAVRHITNSKADQMKMKDRKNMLFVLIKYENEEFGERMREHTLRQFGLLKTKTGCEA